MDKTNYGALYKAENGSEWNDLQFFIRRCLMQQNTSLPAKVLTVSGGGLAPVGFVSIEILVSQVTGNNETVSNPKISNVPYCRVQGGKNAVIIDPEPGDIGIAVFCQRDISSVKRSKKTSPPGSHRVFSMSDAIFVNTCLNGTPEQYIKFDGSGIAVYSPTKITCTAPEILMEAENSITMTAQNVTINASSQMSVKSPMLSASTDVMAGGNIMDQGGQKSMSGMRSTYNSHTHDETQSVTGTPNEQM